MSDQWPSWINANYQNCITFLKMAIANTNVTISIKNYITLSSNVDWIAWSIAIYFNLQLTANFKDGVRLCRLSRY